MTSSMTRLGETIVRSSYIATWIAPRSKQRKKRNKQDGLEQGSLDFNIVGNSSRISTLALVIATFEGSSATNTYGPVNLATPTLGD